MATDPFFDLIKGALESARNPLGVNAIARQINIPVSTVQKYLERQNFFTKTIDRKWSLPNFASAQESGIYTENLDKVVEGQLGAIQATVDILMSQIKATAGFLNTQKFAIPRLQPATEASNTRAVHPKLEALNSHAIRVAEVFKKQASNIPEEYKPLFADFDYITMVLGEGKETTDKFLEEELYDILAGKSQLLSDFAIEKLVEYKNEDDD